MEEEQSQLLLRMPTQLKAQLQREALLQGRKLTQEINMRLRDSIKRDSEIREKMVADAVPYPASTVPTKELPGSYTAAHAHHMVHTNDNGPANALSDIDRAMLTVFHQLPPEKQLALLSLFR